jgi:hypothetical protein
LAGAGEAEANDASEGSADGAISNTRTARVEARFSGFRRRLHRVEPGLRSETPIKQFLGSPEIFLRCLVGRANLGEISRLPTLDISTSTWPARTRSPLSKRMRRMVSATFGVRTMLARLRRTDGLRPSVNVCMPAVTARIFGALPPPPGPRPPGAGATLCRAAIPAEYRIGGRLPDDHQQH